jgi:hypothetical protein
MPGRHSYYVVVFLPFMLQTVGGGGGGTRVYLCYIYSIRAVRQSPVYSGDGAQPWSNHIGFQDQERIAGETYLRFMFVVTTIQIQNMYIFTDQFMYIYLHTTTYTYIELNTGRTYTYIYVHIYMYVYSAYFQVD